MSDTKQSFDDLKPRQVLPTQRDESFWKRENLVAFYSLQLQPCPFCGRDATMDVRLIEHPNWWSACILCDGIKEDMCTAQVIASGDTELEAKENAARLWNQRAYGQEIRLEGDTLYFAGLGTFKRVSE